MSPRVKLLNKSACFLHALIQIWALSSSTNISDKEIVSPFFVCISRLSGAFRIIASTQCPLPSLISEIFVLSSEIFGSESSSIFLTNESWSILIMFPKILDGIHSSILLRSNEPIDPETSFIWIIFLDLSIPNAVISPESNFTTDNSRTITGSISCLPSISIIVASFPCISSPWFPIFVLTPYSLTSAFGKTIFGKIDSSLPHRTTLTDLSFSPLNLNFNAVEGWPFELVNSNKLTTPLIFPVTTRSFCASFILLASIVIEFINGILLLDFFGSIVPPEPMLIVGAPVRSDFTYALIILTRSPGLRFSISGKVAFSSHNFTLTTELES